MGILENAQGADSGESKLKVWGSPKKGKKKGANIFPMVPSKLRLPL
jgi:hypothetical protein